MSGRKLLAINVIKSCLLISVILTFSVATASACTSDYDCNSNAVCVKPSDSISIEGICVTPVDEFGTPEDVSASSVEPHEVTGCEFDTDCDVGFSCFKKSGELDGICVK